MGRGFAVVAQEVKKLAEESRSSTETIRSSVATVETLVKEITPLLVATMNEVQSCTDVFQQVSDTTQHEISAIGNISKAIQSVKNISSEQNDIVKKLMTL